MTIKRQGQDNYKPFKISQIRINIVRTTETPLYCQQNLKSLAEFRSVPSHTIQNQSRVIFCLFLMCSPFARPRCYLLFFLSVNGSLIPFSILPWLLVEQSLLAISYFCLLYIICSKQKLISSRRLFKVQWSTTSFHACQTRLMH